MINMTESQWNLLNRMVNPAPVTLDDDEKSNILQTRLILLQMKELIKDDDHPDTHPDIRQLDNVIQSLNDVIIRYNIDKFNT